MIKKNPQKNVKIAKKKIYLYLGTLLGIPLVVNAYIIMIKK